MKNIIDKIDFHELLVQKYWSFPAAYKGDKVAETKAMIFSQDYIGSRKYDGAFYKFIKDEDGNMELLGRSKGVKGDYLNKIGHVPHLMGFFNSLPNGTCLLGEMFFPNKEGSNNVTTIMGCLEAKAIQRQSGEEKLHYYVFDVLALGNKSLVKMIMEKRVKLLPETNDPYVIVAKYLKGVDLWNELQVILAEGGEGVVITRADSPYQPGKRPARQTLKIKKELQQNVDCIVIGANSPTKDYTGKYIETWRYWENAATGEKIEGDYFAEHVREGILTPVTKSYFHGWAGSLKLGMAKDNKVIEVGSLSGLTEEILNNWKDYKGRVCEVGGMEITADGHIRHPRFVQWRTDKQPKDCDISQLI